MRRHIRHAARKLGLPPGTLVHVGQARAEAPTIAIVDYDEEGVEEREAGTVEDCLRSKDRPTVTWIHVSGVHDVELIQSLGERLGLPQLLLEDVVNTTHRPKMEQLDDHLFMVLKVLTSDEAAGDVQTQQISIVLGESYVVSFAEGGWTGLDAIKERIRASGSRMRRSGPDYLAYRLLDTIVDGYFVVLERLSENAEHLENELLADPTQETLRDLYRLKRAAAEARAAVWPVREVVSGLERCESELLARTTMPYLRDLYDHTIQVIDTIEAIRDQARGMVDTYLSSLSNRMNEVMKVLTMIATVFIPLSFLAGLYGMNFVNIPELKLSWGYFGLLGVMGGIAAAMLAYFRKKGWL